ncbi:MAG: DUF5011 domain-containing protein [Bacilli bacterium]|nr:DUF5011 domain-containing protein [Bacilli bacterium]MBN2697102.1 DUF5011 domain-containing protein [Bacilli bacterium]
MRSRLILAIFAILLVIGLAGCLNVEASDISISLKAGIDTVEINQEFVDAGAIAKVRNWNIGYDVVSDTVDVSAIGTYEIVYETSYRGFTKRIVRIVTVVDETAPEVDLNAGLDTIYEGDSWIDAGVEATDNSLGTVEIEIIGSVSTAVAGEYMITYVVTDASGNETNVIRYVNVLKKS